MATTPADDEIRGDWNNLKGTHYHLVYALWLLLRQQASEVAFYAGNDLRAIPPPALGGEPETTDPISVRSRAGGKDIWIQLKATFASWSPSDLLSDNLLPNFVINALTSQRQGREWEARLVSQGTVDRGPVLDFAKDPPAFKKLAPKLDRVVASVQARLGDAADTPTEPETTIRALALQVLRSLATSEPVSLAGLKGEIEAELAYLRPSRIAVFRTANLLLGAMLEDSAGGPAKARAYDAWWLDTVAGPGFRLRLSFDLDEGGGCDDAVARALPASWTSDRFSPRAHLQRLLAEFLAARETIFVLLGDSGTGKSWALADWAQRELAGRIRLYCPGLAFDLSPTLEGLVATALSPLTGAPLDEQGYLNRFLAAAMGRAAGPAVVILDGLDPGQMAAEQLRHRLGRLTTQASRHGVKLILGCRTASWHLHQLWQELPAGAAFLPDPLSTSEQRRQSFVLDDFSPDERSDAVERFLPPKRAEHARLQLLGPGLETLANPYLLGLYLDQHGHNLGDPDRAPDPVTITGLLQEQTRRQAAQVAAILSVDVGVVEGGLADLVGRLWRQRPGPLPHADVVRALEEVVPTQGRAALDALHRVGLLSVLGGIRLADGPVAYQLYARHLLAREEGGEDLCSLLQPERDGDVVVELLQTAPDPVAMADRLVRQDARWTDAVVAGLSWCSPDDLRVVALLAGLARPLGEELANHEGCRALGRLGARGGLAWEWVRAMYCCEHRTEQYRGERALGAVVELAPHRVGPVIRGRLGAERQRAANRDEKDRMTRLAGAIAPLEHAVHPPGAEVARNLLLEFSALVPESPCDGVERLLDAIDDVRGRVAMFGSDAEFDALCAELVDANADTRYRAAGALRRVAMEAPDRVADLFLQRLRTEAEPRVLARLLWNGPRVLEQRPDDFLAALEAGTALDWREPRLVGTALTILAVAARTRPAEVLRLLPRRLSSCEPWCRAYFSALFVYAWWCCAEREPAAIAHLRTLGEPDLVGVIPLFRPFAWHGAAVGSLASICLVSRLTKPAMNWRSSDTSWSGSFAQKSQGFQLLTWVCHHSRIHCKFCETKH